MRKLAWMILALLPCAALADEPQERPGGDPVKTCDDMGNSARAWAAACTAAIQSGRFTDPSILSNLYTNLGFADINLALQTDNNFDKALADLNEAVRLDPDNASAINNRANAHMYRGEYDASLADIAAVLRLTPDEPKAHDLRCVVLTKMKRASEGLPECLRAIVLGSIHAWTYLDLGAAYEGAGDLGMAESAYRRALELDPSSAEAMRGLIRSRRPPPV